MTRATFCTTRSAVSPEFRPPREDSSITASMIDAAAAVCPRSHSQARVNSATSGLAAENDSTPPVHSNAIHSSSVTTKTGHG